MVRVQALRNNDYGFTIGGGGSYYKKQHENDQPSADWWEQDIQKFAAKKARQAKYDAIEDQYKKGIKVTDYNSIFGGSAGGGSTAAASAARAANSNNNASDGNFWGGSFESNQENLIKAAKDISKIQFGQTKNLMELSSGYRSKEAKQLHGFDLKKMEAGSTHNQREAAQNFGFQKDLSNLGYQHRLGLQDDTQAHELQMFNNQEQAYMQRKANEVRLASNLWRKR